jgi:hypothetical protein
MTFTPWASRAPEGREGLRDVRVAAHGPAGLGLDHAWSPRGGGGVSFARPCISTAI